MDSVRFRTWALALVLFYVVVSSLYAIRLPRVMDEFGMAHAVLDVAQKVPYRDYCPPKTLLGYYFYAPPLLWISDAWNALTWAKLQLVLLTAIVLLAAAFTLRSLASDRAVLISLALFVVMSTWLERSMELRNDPISMLFGLASLLCLVRGRAFLGGIFCALSFLATQKGIYFVAAAEVAVVAVWVRDRTMRAFRTLVALNLGGAVIALLYWGLWALVASPDGILRCTVMHEGNIALALQDFYDIRAKYWIQTLVRNPFYYGLSAVSLAILAIRWVRPRSDHAIAVVTPYAFVITAAAVWHKQPWPYFFINLIPTLFVANAVALTILLPKLRARRAFVIAALLIGILLPLSRLPVALTRDNSHQKVTFRLAERLLAPGEKYLDGTGMLYRHDNPASVLEWIDVPVLGYLKSLNAEETDKLVQAIDRGPTKLLIFNYRVASLPPRLATAIGARFAPSFGNVFLYAPIIDTPSFSLAFDGTYVVEAPSRVTIDGKSVLPKETIDLRKGVHTLRGAEAIRLRLLPPRGIDVDPEFAQPRNLYPFVYDY